MSSKKRDFFHFKFGSEFISRVPSVFRPPSSGIFLLLHPGAEAGLKGKLASTAPFWYTRGPAPPGPASRRAVEGRGGGAWPAPGPRAVPVLPSHHPHPKSGFSWGSCYQFSLGSGGGAEGWCGAGLTQCRSLEAGRRARGPGGQGRGCLTGKILLAAQFTNPTSCLSVCLSR